MRMRWILAAVFASLGLSSLWVLAEQPPSPPAAPVPPAQIQYSQLPDEAPRPPAPPAPEIQPQRLDLQVVNTCNWPVVMLTCRTTSADWTGKAIAQADTIGHIALSGQGPFDILVQQRISSTAWTEFRIRRISFLNMNGPPTLVDLVFEAAGSRIWNGWEWNSYASPPGTRATIRAVIGDGRILILIPMIIEQWRAAVPTREYVPNVRYDPPLPVPPPPPPPPTPNPNPRP